MTTQCSYRGWLLINGRRLLGKCANDALPHMTVCEEHLNDAATFLLANDYAKALQKIAELEDKVRTAKEALDGETTVEE